jgi:hypothetical protein
MQRFNRNDHTRHLAHSGGDPQYYSRLCIKTNWWMSSEPGTRRTYPGHLKTSTWGIRVSTGNDLTVIRQMSVGEASPPNPYLDLREVQYPLA